MTNIKANERFIPLKNYILAAIVVVVIIGLTLYGFAWYNVIQEKKVSNSYLIEKRIISNEVKELSEINDVFSEAPDTYFVYVSYTGNKEIYNLEKSLKSTIKKYDLNEIFYYINVTAIKDDKNIIDDLNKELKLQDKNIIKNLPVIIYYEGGEVKDVLNSKKDNIITSNDFQKMLDKNKISK